MMKSENLHLLIDEEIYMIDQRKGGNTSSSSNQSSVPGNQSPKESSQSIKEETPREVERVEIAFIHETDNSEELELLNKIVEACKLEASRFKIIKKEANLIFEKGIIFTSSANMYYEPVNDNGNKILNAKPLAELMVSEKDKKDLWSSLQAFVKA